MIQLPNWRVNTARYVILQDTKLENAKAVPTALKWDIYYPHAREWIRSLGIRNLERDYDKAFKNTAKETRGKEEITGLRLTSYQG